ncbi:hypothetical protein ACTXT7_011123 [Hymenolepis weldensis]
MGIHSELEVTVGSITSSTTGLWMTLRLLNERDQESPLPLPCGSTNVISSFRGFDKRHHLDKLLEDHIKTAAKMIFQNGGRFREFNMNTHMGHRKSKEHLIIGIKKKLQLSNRSSRTNRLFSISPSDHYKSQLESIHNKGEKEVELMPNLDENEALIEDTNWTIGCTALKFMYIMK